MARLIIFFIEDALYKFTFWLIDWLTVAVWLYSSASRYSRTPSWTCKPLRHRVVIVCYESLVVVMCVCCDSQTAAVLMAQFARRPPPRPVTRKFVLVGHQLIVWTPWVLSHLFCVYFCIFYLIFKVRYLSMKSTDTVLFFSAVEALRFLCICYQTCEQDIWKMNETILMPVGNSGPWGRAWNGLFLKVKRWM